MSGVTMSNASASEQRYFAENNDPLATMDENVQSVQPENTVESQQGLAERVRGTVTKFGSVSEIVRFAGVGALVLSMFLFLLDGINIVNDTQRYFSMLLLTGLLGAGGFILALALKEQRGARAFFGLALLSVPVNFTVLGALVYSVFRIDSTNTVYPQLAQWTLSSVASLGSTALLSMVVLLPVSLFAMSVLARENRKWLSLSLLASCSLLLLPVRDTMWIVPLVGAAVMALLFVVKKYSADSVALKTTGGRYVQALLFLPIGIMLVRSVWLYDISALAMTMVSFTVFVLLRQFSNRLEGKLLLTHAVYLLTALSGLAVATYAIIAAEAVLPSNSLILVFSLVFAVLMLEFDRREKFGEFDDVLSIGWFIVLASAVLWNELVFGGVITLLYSLLIATAMIAMAVVYRSKVRFSISLAALALIAVLNASTLIEFVSTAGWIGLALVGAVAIVLASFIDRFGALFAVKLSNTLQEN